MNKVILGLILAVCLLGMALVMLNERLGRKNEVASTSPAIEVNATRPVPPDSWSDSQITGNQGEASSETAENAMAIEKTEAQEALAPPPPAALPQPAPELAANREDSTPPAPPRTQAESPSRAENLPAAQPQAPARTEPAPEQASRPAPAKVEKSPERQTAPKTDRQPAGRVVNRFVVFARDGGATIRVASPAQMHFTSMTLENPDRVVVDMDGNWQFPASPGIPKNEMVSNIRTGKMGEKTRVVIDLKAKPRSVRVIPAKNGDGYDVRVDK